MEADALGLELAAAREACAEMRAARGAARDALADVSAQNARLLGAYVEKKGEAGRLRDALHAHQAAAEVRLEEQRRACAEGGGARLVVGGCPAARAAWASKAPIHRHHASSPPPNPTSSRLASAPSKRSCALPRPAVERWASCPRRRPARPCMHVRPRPRQLSTRLPLRPQAPALQQAASLQCAAPPRSAPPAHRSERRPPRRRPPTTTRMPTWQATPAARALHGRGGSAIAGRPALPAAGSGGMRSGLSCCTCWSGCRTS